MWEKFVGFPHLPATHQSPTLHAGLSHQHPSLPCHGLGIAKPTAYFPAGSVRSGSAPGPSESHVD